MTKISDSIIIRTNDIKNRIVMEPIYTFSFQGDDGAFYGTQHLEHYTRCAKGGVGLLIVQGTSVFGASKKKELWTDKSTDILRQIATNSHQYQTKVILQLACNDIDINNLTIEEIHSMQHDMTRAAIITSELGFDGVEYHFAHGFTLCKFLDAAFNKRTDSYGGIIDNRARILTEIIPVIRKETPDSFILGVRMGLDQPEHIDGIEAAKTFERAGIDLLNISFGLQLPKVVTPKDYPCSAITYSASIIRSEVDIPVIAVNKITTKEQASFLIEHDYADFVGIGRAILADPEFAGHILNGQEINRCHQCKKCLWFKDHTKCPARKEKLQGCNIR